MRRSPELDRAAVFLGGEHTSSRPTSSTGARDQGHRPGRGKTSADSPGRAAAGKASTSTRRPRTCRARLIAEATGTSPVGFCRVLVVAWQGQERTAVELLETTTRLATVGRLGRLSTVADHASAVLYNGLGRHDAARDSALSAFERDDFGYTPFVITELAEAASRTHDQAMVTTLLRHLTERSDATPTQWALGTEACVRALASDGDTAETCYRESIDRLNRTRMRAYLARVHLLYGEWLRREKRRAEARHHGHRGLCRACPPRAPGHWGNGPQTQRHHGDRAHRAGGTDRPASP
jgi:hypothetical protein